MYQIQILHLTQEQVVNCETSLTEEERFRILKLMALNNFVWYGLRIKFSERFLGDAKVSQHSVRVISSFSKTSIDKTISQNSDER